MTEKNYDFVPPYKVKIGDIEIECGQFPVPVIEAVCHVQELLSFLVGFL